MKKLLNIFVFTLYLISPTSVYSIEHPNIKNLILHKKPIKLDNFEFTTQDKEKVRLYDFNNKLLIVNFWATWCTPCRDEMPSLEKLSKNKNFKNLLIIPINIGEDPSKANKFFKNININNLKIYLDQNSILPKKLLLRGLPTSLVINKNGDELSRILGAIDFEDQTFISWLKKYD